MAKNGVISMACTIVMDLPQSRQIQYVSEFNPLGRRDDEQGPGMLERGE